MFSRNRATERNGEWLTGIQKSQVRFFSTALITKMWPQSTSLIKTKMTVVTKCPSDEWKCQLALRHLKNCWFVWHNASRCTDQTLKMPLGHNRAQRVLSMLVSNRISGRRSWKENVFTARTEHTLIRNRSKGTWFILQKLTKRTSQWGSQTRDPPGCQEVKESRILWWSTTHHRPLLHEPGTNRCANGTLEINWQYLGLVSYESRCVSWRYRQCEVLG